MAKKPPVPETATSSTPKEFPEVTPRDLYPTSDIRFVMTEVGKLTANVDRLISDVRGQGEKLDALRNQVSFVRGGIYVLGAVLAIVAFLLNAKWDAVLRAIEAVSK